VAKREQRTVQVSNHPTPKRLVRKVEEVVAVVRVAIGIGVANVVNVIRPVKSKPTQMGLKKVEIGGAVSITCLVVTINRNQRAAQVSVLWSKLVSSNLRLGTP